MTRLVRQPDCSQPAPRRWARTAAAWALGAATLAAAGAAQAREDVFWSIGLASPGVQLAVGNAPAVVVHPRPVVVQAAPVVHVQPAPVWVQPAPLWVQPAPVRVVPAPVAVVGGYPHHHAHHPRWHGHRRGQDRNHNGVPDRFEYRY
jgi:hypothetical protein